MDSLKDLDVAARIRAMVTGSSRSVERVIGVGGLGAFSQVGIRVLSPEQTGGALTTGNFDNAGTVLYRPKRLNWPTSTRVSIPKSEKQGK